VPRFILPLSACLFVLSLANPTPASSCMVDSTPIALVDTGLSSIPTPLEVRVDPEGDGCRASLSLTVSSLPSRRLVPAPRELAEQLVPIARAFGAKKCEIGVFVDDKEAPEAERFGTDSCRRGEFRYDDGSWWAVGEDGPCWE